MYYIIGYFIPVFIGLFIVTPYLKNRTHYLNLHDSDKSLDGTKEIIPGVVGSIFWPISLLMAACYFLIYVPAKFLFTFSDEYFKIKPAKIPPVNQAKSTYRHVELNK